MSFTSAIVKPNPTMTIVANPIIFNIRVLVRSSVGKVTSLNVETLNCICLFMIHSKHHQMTCSEEDVHVKKLT